MGVQTRRSAFKSSKRDNFKRPFTPRGWLRSASNFAKTRFRRFPTFHFSTPKKQKTSFFRRTLNGRLPLEHGSVRPQTLVKRVSGDPRHFIFRSPEYFLRQNCSSEKIWSTPQKCFQQSACFGGAMKVWTSLAGAHRKFIARHIGFGLLRPLVEG